MKLAVIAVDKERQDEVIAVLDRAGVAGFSLFPSVLGRGETGAHFGNRAFPGDNAMIVALVTAAQLDQVRRELQDLSTRLRPGQGLMAIGMDAEKLV